MTRLPSRPEAWCAACRRVVVPDLHGDRVFGERCGHYLGAWLRETKTIIQCDDAKRASDWRRNPPTAIAP